MKLKSTQNHFLTLPTKKKILKFTQNIFSILKSLKKKIFLKVALAVLFRSDHKHLFKGEWKEYSGSQIPPSQSSTVKLFEMKTKWEATEQEWNRRHNHWTDQRRKET